MVMSIFIQDLVDNYTLYHFIYDTLINKANDMSEEDVYDWISDRIRIIEGMSRFPNIESIKRKEQLKEIFGPTMLDDGFATEFEFGFKSIKSSMKR